MRLAVAQSPAALAGFEARRAWLETVLATVEADMLVLPELFACGYNIGDDVYSAAEGVDGPIFQAMASLASEFKIALHYGFAERSGEQLFNAAACVAPNGTLLTCQRKLAIPPGFERDYFSPGAGCELFSYCGVRFATLICYDAEFPETARFAAANGAQVLLVPTALGASWGWVARQMIPTRAYENGVYLAYANHAGEQNGLAFLGESVIAGPDGIEDTRATDEPGVISTKIDLTRVTAAQARLPYLQDRLNLRLSQDADQSMPS